MAQIISCVAVIIFARCTQSYEKHPGLTVMGGIAAALILSVLFIPEKPKKLTPVEAGQEFLCKHIPEDILEDPDQDSMSFALGTIFYYYCFGEGKADNLPAYLKSETLEKMREWRVQKPDASKLKEHLDLLKGKFGETEYDDSGNELFTEVKAFVLPESRGSTLFMQAWAAINESDNV
ncbi:MAG: hypothetical protein ChlgKO_00200 [Chlamydiales bacterium]